MGGSGLIATRLGLYLAESGHDIHFIFYKKPFLLGDFDKYDNITYHELNRTSYALFSEIGSPFTIQSASKIVDIVKKEKIDIIHSHYAIPHAVASYLASKIVPLKTIVTTHGSDTHTLGHHPNYQSVVSLALKNTSCVTSVSNFLARETEKVYQLNINSVKVIYDFIDTNEFRPFGINRTKSIVQASNFRSVKQVPKLIEIFAKIILDHGYTDWKLDLIGNGPDWPLCLRLSRKLKIKSFVNFLGVKNNIPELFSTASILASTSTVESFGLTIAEGMSCETPVWAPRVGGIPELCIDGENGLLFDPEDGEDAVDKLLKLVEDEEYRRKLGEKGRERIKNHFSTKIIVKQFETLYNSVINLDD